MPFNTAIRNTRNTRNTRTNSGRLRSTTAAFGFVLVAAAGSITLASVAHAAPPSFTTTGTSQLVVPGGQRIDDPIATEAAVGLMLLRTANETGLEGDLSAYVMQRNLVAGSVADRLGFDELAMKEAWAKADTVHQEALMAGLSQLGVPYRRNTSKVGVGFDCSGLTTYAWGEAGVDLVRQSTAQIRAAAPRTFETAQAGDLMQYPGHVMMWLGVDHAILHASDPGRPIQVDSGPQRRTVRLGDPTG